MIEAVAIVRRTPKHQAIVDCCEELGLRRFGNAANAAAQMIRESATFRTWAERNGIDPETMGPVGQEAEAK